MPVTDSLGGDLRAYLFRVCLETPHDDLTHHWVMSQEWLDECYRYFGSTPGRDDSVPAYLMGMPIEVREDGGVPHLEEM